MKQESDVEIVVIGITGHGPYPEEVLREFIQQRGWIVGGRNIWQEDQIIVIGRNDFDKKYLLQSLELDIDPPRGLSIDVTCQYIRQEDLFRYIVEGEVPNLDWYSISEHPGLQYLSSIGFTWPSTEASLITGRGTGALSSRLRPQHEVLSVFGYRAGKGTSTETRRRSLRKAIDENNLGLRKVAEHIAGLVKIAKSYKTRNLEIAIDNWEADLDWLYGNFYKDSGYSKLWPWPDH